LDRLSPPELVLYGREGCHLCHLMLAALGAYTLGRGLRYREIDVDEDDGLRSRYGHLVPVLHLGEREICRYRFDPEALDAALADFR
jgi:hypothetical protein